MICSQNTVSILLGTKRLKKMSRLHHNVGQFNHLYVLILGDTNLHNVRPDITSTPVKEKPKKKHPLTPSAKAIEPASKRRTPVSERSTYSSSPSTSKSGAETGKCNLGGFQIRKRRSSLASLINEHYELSVSETDVVTQADMLQTLGLKHDDKYRLTQAITKLFQILKQLDM